MWTGIVLTMLGLLSLALLAVAVSQRRLDESEARLVAELMSERESPPGRGFRPEDLSGLPAPVRRYLSRVIPRGQPPVTAVRLRQTGNFRLGDRSSPWKPLEATQHFTVHPPGFVWQARIEMAPLVRARVVDLYKGGQGALRAKVFSALTVAEAQGTPEIDAGELMRYLGEAVWFPTALLPGQGVEWLAIDDHSARATLIHGDTRVSLDFHFNDRDEVEQVHAQGRFREVDGGYEPTPWTGTWRNYETRNGLCIPTAGQVAWNLPDGDLPYWRAHLDEIHHELAGEQAQRSSWARH